MKVEPMLIRFSPMNAARSDARMLPLAGVEIALAAFDAAERIDCADHSASTRRVFK